MGKCIASPTGFEAQTELLQSLFGCRVDDFLCRYLGIPLSIHKLRRSEEKDLIAAVAKRILAWKGTCSIWRGGQLWPPSRSQPSQFPTHICIAVCLSPWAVGEIDKRRRTFLWSGSDHVAGGLCRFAWQVACRTKELGALRDTD